MKPMQPAEEKPMKPGCKPKAVDKPMKKESYRDIMLSHKGAKK